MDINTGSTKEIMANSHMEITNPDFNKMVLNKIIKRQKKKIDHFSYFFLFAYCSSYCRYNCHPDKGGLGSLADGIQKTIIQLGTWFLNYEFIILPFFILLIIKGLIDITLHRRFHN